MKRTIISGLAGLLTASSLFFPNYETSVYSQNRQYKIQNSKYHPLIEDFEKRLEREISTWIPTYNEMKEMESLNDREDLDKNEIRESRVIQKIIKIQANPKLIQNNPYYEEFNKELNDVYKFPNKEGFLDNYFEELSNFIHNEGEDEFIEKALEKGVSRNGISVNLRNPKDADKAFIFLGWINELKREILEAKMIEAKIKPPRADFKEFDGYSEKSFGMSKENNMRLMNKVLDQLAETDKPPVKDFKDSKYVREYPRELSQFVVDYSKYFERLSDDDKPIISGVWNDRNKNNKMEITEFEDLYKPIFVEDEEMNFKVYSLKDRLANISNIRLFNPKGEKIVESDGKGFGVILEDLVKIGGFGIYTAGISVNNYIWQVRQFRVVPDNLLGIAWAYYKKPSNPKQVQHIIKQYEKSKSGIQWAPAPPLEEKGPGEKVKLSNLYITKILKKEKDEIPVAPPPAPAPPPSKKS